MIVQDDRTEEQRVTHNVLIVGNDSFLSGWGEAENGKSVTAWACEWSNRKAVLDWVKSRSDMRYVRMVFERNGKPYSPHNAKHYHVYVVTEKHPSLERES